jgi:rod shape-determining protein MreC
MGDVTKRLRFFVSILVLLVSLLVISKNDELIYEQGPFERAMIEAVGPIQGFLSGLKFSFFTFFTDYVKNANASRHNRELSAKVLQLEEEIFRLEELKTENSRLKELLGFGQEITGKRVLAQVVAWDISDYYKVLRINKGAKDGIKLQDAIITSGGLVGHIYRLADNFADVLTVLDVNHRVDVIIARTRVHGIVEGLSQNRCVVKYLPRAGQVKLGDVVITSGIGNIYPKGIKIGDVVKVEREMFGIGQYIEITPSVNFNSLEEVIVLIDARKDIPSDSWVSLSDDL